MEKPLILISHTSHLDLYWMAAQPECLEMGAKIIDDAVNFALEDKGFCFVVESVRFAEYYLRKYPEREAVLRKLIETGQFEFAACYSDRHEHFHDGESYVRNIMYGKRLLKKMLDYDSKFSFHPDLPGFSEQTPQIHKKSGVPVYFQTRGYRTGARFNWEALDGSSVIHFNFPGHYAGTSLDELIVPNIEEIKKSLGMDNAIVLAGSGDGGDAGTYPTRMGEKRGRFPLKDVLKYVADKCGVEFKMVSPCATVLAQDNSNLVSLKGEGPNRWGANGAANHVIMFQRDKTVNGVICDAEKLSAIAKKIGIDVTEQVQEDCHKAMGTFRGWNRRYFDKFMFTDKSKVYPLNEWFDFAWRLLVTTHDHNYGGTEASQGDFDRFMFQNTGERIAKAVIDASLSEIGGKVKADKGDVLAFNTLNWERSDIVAAEIGVDCSKNYIAVDEKGNESPVMCSGGKCIFKTDGVPSIGYKIYSIKEADEPVIRPASLIAKEADAITMQNEYYSIKVNTVKGTIENITDRETGFSLSGDFLHTRTYEDLVVGAGEKTADWKLLDDSSDHVSSVKITADNAYMTTLTIKTEVMKSNFVIDIDLYHFEKRIDIKPNLFWAGTKQLKICMSLPYMPSLKDIYYGVPYGAQKYGNLLVEPTSFGGDEIIYELYERYRDIHYWMAMEDGGNGYSLSTLHSAVDFKSDGVDAILVRNFRSGADPAYYYTNAGELSWNFSFFSYKGGWEENCVYRRAWEMLHPLFVKTIETTDGSLDNRHSFIDTGGTGIVTVYKVSDINPDDYTLRMFNPSSTELPLKLSGSIGDADWECRNIDETPCDDPVDILKTYEIKTLIS